MIVTIFLSIHRLDARRVCELTKKLSHFFTFLNYNTIKRLVKVRNYET